MRIVNYQPKVLTQYLENISIYSFEGEKVVQLHPKGTFELVFQDNNHFQHNTFYSGGWDRRPEAFLGGLHDHFYTVKPIAKNGYCIAVEFKPNAAKYFISGPLHVFKNELVDINNEWGNLGWELSIRLKEEKQNEKRVELIEHFLMKQFIQLKKSHIERSIELIHIKKGFIKIGELAKEAELSSAQFRKRFNEEVGIAPSQYCKIKRVNTILPVLKSSSKSLTELAYDLGYFDQSHFIKDFKSVAGSSPKHYLT